MLWVVITIAIDQSKPPLTYLTQWQVLSGQ